VGKISVFFYKFSNFDIEKTTFTIELKNDSNISKETEPDYMGITFYFCKRKMNGFYFYLLIWTGFTGFLGYFRQLAIQFCAKSTKHFSVSL